KWTEAVHCYKRILDIQKRKSDGRPDQIAQAICDCGNALYELYKVALKDRSALRNILDETIELYTQALALYENLGAGYESSAIEMLQLIARSNKDQKKWGEADRCYQRIMNIQKQIANGRPDQKAQALSDYSNALYQLCDYAAKNGGSAFHSSVNKTIELYIQALALYESLGAEYESCVTDTLDMIARSYR